MTKDYGTHWLCLNITVIARYQFPLIPYPGTQCQIWPHWIPALSWVLLFSVFWCCLRNKVQLKAPWCYFYIHRNLVCWQRNLRKFTWAHKTGFQRKTDKFTVWALASVLLFLGEGRHRYTVACLFIYIMSFSTLFFLIFRKSHRLQQELIPAVMHSPQSCLYPDPHP